MKKINIRRFLLVSLLVIAMSLALALVPSAPASADPGPGLAALWHFDEGTGTTAFDSSGNDNHGTLKSTGSEPSWVNGKFGKALSFDGVNDYVEVAHSISLDITSAITVEGWIKLASFSQQATVAGKWRDLGTNNRGYLLTVDTSGKPRFYISTDGSNYPVAIAPTALSLNTWYHLAGTYDGTNIKLYVNGVLVKTTAQTGSIFSNTEPLLIGANDGWGGTLRKFTNGLIDEVRIWNEALTAGQIALSYSGSVTWLPPVTNADFTLQEGTTLPLKFQLYDNGNLVTSQQDVSLEITMNGSTIFTFGLGDGVDNLRWNDDEDHYIANLKAKDWTEGTYRATVFWDGVVINETIMFYISPSKGAGRGNSGK